MRIALAALLAVPFLMAAAPAPAPAPSPSPSRDQADIMMVGVGVGGGLVGAPTSASGTVNTNLQWNSLLAFRGPLLTSFTEGTIGLLSRSQALGVNHTEVFETSGLVLGFGAKYRGFHAGLEGEADLLHQIVPDPSTAGTLMFHEGAGLVLEPYVGVTLPFLRSEFSTLDLTLHYPIWKLLDDSIGPRLELTLWVGTPPKADKDDDDSDESGASQARTGVKGGHTKDGGLKGQPGETIITPEPPSAAPKKHSRPRSGQSKP